MKRTGYHILRLGVGITFVWVSIMIFQNPVGWGRMLSPWVLNILPVPIEQIMFSTALLDLFIGIFLILNFLPWPASILGSVHLLLILIGAGINAITVRDIGLLAATLALAIETWPAKFDLNFFKKKINLENS